MDTKPTLNPKQTKFVEEYLISGNGKQAATIAGYSPKTADSIASRLLKNVKVKSEVDKQRGKMSIVAGITRQMVIDEIGSIAFSKVDINVKAGDKLRGLELLGKHFKMFTDKIEHSDSSAEKLIDHLKGLASELPD